MLRVSALILSMPCPQDAAAVFFFDAIHGRYDIVLFTWRDTCCRHVDIAAAAIAYIDVIIACLRLRCCRRCSILPLAMPLLMLLLFTRHVISDCCYAMLHMRYKTCLPPLRMLLLILRYYYADT